MTSTDFSWDLGSFRDPAGGVFFSNGSVFRSMSEEVREEVNKLFDSYFFQKLMGAGDVIQSHLIKNTFDIPGETIIQHENIPFISYPFEWSFSMLKDAALSTLNLLKTCIQNGFILKDGTAWNLTYYQGKMVFFDILSIESYQEGQAWNGYQQFCQEFLYPLLLKAHKNLNFNDYFKGSLCGIDIKLMDKIFHLRDIFKPGVFKHVYLNARLTSNKKINASTINKKYKLSQFALLALVEDLLSIVQKLDYRSNHSVWIDYASNNTYTAQDENEKVDFVKAFLSTLPNHSNIVDLGCNTGKYSFIASQDHEVVACDLDTDCIDDIYKKMSKEQNKSITPLVLNLMNPSANAGWGLTERKSIFERIKADGFLSLALIHHLCIANNIPIEHYIKFLHQTAPAGVLEWVEKEDPMVKFLLRNRKDIFSNYHWDYFAQTVNKYFHIKDIKVLNGGHRKLCWLERKELL